MGTRHTGRQRRYCRIRFMPETNEGNLHLCHRCSRQGENLAPALFNSLVNWIVTTAYIIQTGRGTRRDVYARIYGSCNASCSNGSRRREIHGELCLLLYDFVYSIPISISQQCALERKIPIVKPSWIMENYQIWLKGDDVDMAQVCSLIALDVTWS